MMTAQRHDALEESKTSADQADTRQLFPIGLILTAALTVLTGAFIRIWATTRIEGFSFDHAEGLLKSDPGLLAYITQRIVDAGGGIPADFRADPRIEWPLTTDIPALETVGQEFLVAWMKLALGDAAPLHVVAVITMAFTASMAVVGVIGLAWELTRDARLAALAAVFYLLCTANYRTLGFILIREDLSLPLYALHLWLLARAVRLRTPGALFAAALTFTASIATWHAMQFIATIEVACLYAWFVLHGHNPLRGRAAWLVPGVFITGCLLVPVLLAKRTYASPLACAVLSLGLTAWLESRYRFVAARPRTTALALLVLAAVGGSLVGSTKDYSHVYALMAQKLVHLGELPVDPHALSFEARLLWHGPFQSSTFTEVIGSLGPLAVLFLAGLIALLPLLRTPKAELRPLALLAAFGTSAVIVALLVARLRVLVGLVAPVIAVVFLAHMSKRGLRPLVLGLCIAQGTLFFDDVTSRQLETWYLPKYLPAWRETVAFMQKNIDPSAAVVSDYVSSTIVLAHTKNATVVQPKYETLRSRERIREGLDAFYSGSPEALRSLVTGKLKARYFLLSVEHMWSMRYAAGVPLVGAGPKPGSAAAALLSGRPETYANVPGFVLLHEARSGPAPIRLYEVRP